MAERQRTLWDEKSAREFAEKFGPDALEKQIDEEMTWNGMLSPFPPTAAMVRRVAATIRREQLEATANEERSRRDVEIDIARQQTNLAERQAVAAEQSSRASIRSADAAVASAASGEKAASAAERSAASGEKATLAAERSAYAGELSADAAKTNADIAKEALKWSRRSSIFAGIAIPISVIAVLVAWLK